MVLVPDVASARSSECVDLQRASARQALSRCANYSAAPASGWEKDEHNVPLLNDGFHWSISHKKQWAAAVISDMPVGIDVERIVSRRPEMLDELAGAQEWNIIGDRSWLSFFRVWTAKEAALKSIGLGIGNFARCVLDQVDNDHSLTVLLDGAVRRVAHHVIGDHIVAVAGEFAGVEWHMIASHAVPQDPQPHPHDRA